MINRSGTSQADSWICGIGNNYCASGCYGITCAVLCRIGDSVGARCCANLIVGDYCHRSIDQIGCGGTGIIVDAALFMVDGG